MCLWYVQHNDGDWSISWNSVSGLGDPWPGLVLHQGMSGDLWLPWGEPLYNSLQWPELGEQLESQQRGQSGLKWELSILGASDQREEETQQKLVNRGSLALSVTQNSLVFMWSAGQQQQICWITTKSPLSVCLKWSQSIIMSSSQTISQSSEYLLQNNYLLYKGWILYVMNLKYYCERQNIS